MCLRFVFLLITRLTAWFRLARREEAWKIAEILLLRHQLAVLQRQQPRRPKLNWADRALLATLLSVIPKARRPGLRLLVTPDTILRWHRDLIRRRWAARSIRGKTGRPATRRNIRALVLRLARVSTANWCRRWWPGESPHPSGSLVLGGPGATSSGAGLAHAERLAFGGHDDGVVQEPVEQADGGGVLGQEPAPLVEGPVGADAQSAAFIGGCDEPEQQLGAGVVERGEPYLVENGTSWPWSSMTRPTELSARPR